jgi:tetratricopeptide (TPR) repeat protein
MATSRAVALLVALAACGGAVDGRARPDGSRRGPAAVIADSVSLRLAARWAEAERRVNQALGAPGLAREDSVRLLVERASIEREVGWFRRRAASDQSMRTVERAEAMVDARTSPATRAAVVEARAWLVYWRGFEEKESFDRALPLFERARRLREQAGDRAGLASSWFEIGLVHQQTGRLDRAQAAFVRGHRIATAERLPVDLAYLERHMGANAEQAGRLMDALTHYRRSLKLRADSGHRWGVVFAAITLADLEARRHDRAGAQSLLQRASSLAVELDLPVGEASAAESQAGLARAAGRGDEACSHLAAAVRAWTRYGDSAAAAGARARATEWSCSPRSPR